MLNVILILMIFASVTTCHAKNNEKKGKRSGKMTMTLKCDDISNGERIPDKFTCEGADVSPKLTWEGIPESARELVLIMDDPDAPMGTWTHWIVYGISPERKTLPENVEKSAEVKSLGIRQGITSFRKPGYGGPCPPPGPTHHYYFKLYALKTSSGLSAGASLKDVEKVIKVKTISKTQLMGTYSR